MKIAIITPASIPATQFGGILFLGVNAARILSKKGNEVTIFTTDLDLANNPTTFNKKLQRLEKVENFHINRTHVWFSKYLFFVNPGMYRQLMNSDMDIIHAIGIRSFQAIIAAIVSKKKKIPLIISDQGGLTTHPDIKNSNLFKKILINLQQPILKFIINQSKIVIVPNEYEKNIFEKFCSNSKIEIIKNGVDINELKKPNFSFKQKNKIENKFILFLGRFDKIKGIDTLLLAINNIKKQINNYKFVLMGADFGYESQMKKMIEELQIQKNIILIKKPTREEVIAAYYESEYLVLPSRWELSPLTPLEGFACKKTIISTTAHGIPFTLSNNVDSLLVPPGDPIKLGEAIILLLNNPELREKLENAGQKLVYNECNSEIMIEKYFLIYKKAIEDGQ